MGVSVRAFKTRFNRNVTELLTIVLLSDFADTMKADERKKRAAKAIRHQPRPFDINAINVQNLY